MRCSPHYILTIATALTLIVGPLSSGCSNNSKEPIAPNPVASNAKKPDSVQEFWSYFVTIAPQISAKSKPDPKLVEGISSHLSAVENRLAWQVGPVDKVWLLEISADGNPELIQTVKQVVAAAPKIPGWQVAAFRQRMKVQTTLEFQGKRHSLDSIQFVGAPSGKKVTLTIYVPGLTATNREEWIGAIFLNLDSLIGEYDVMTRIEIEDFLPLDSGSPKSKLRPIKDLVRLVDGLGPKVD